MGQGTEQVFTRMPMVDMQTGTCTGRVRQGPQFYQKSLILGTDPVATDQIALEVYLRNCATHQNIPPDHHRNLAGTRYGAGISDRERIDLVEVTV